MASRVTTVALEVLDSGATSRAVVTTDAAEVLHKGATTSARVSAVALETLRLVSGNRVTTVAAEVLRSLAKAPPSGQPAYYMVCLGDTNSRNETMYGGWTTSGTSGGTLRAEADQNIKLRGTGGIFSNMGVQCVLNGLIGTSTMRFRKNLLDGFQNISIPAGSTGWFEDTDNIDTAYEGDYVGFRMVTGAGNFGDVNNFQWRAAFCKFVPDTSHTIVQGATNTSTNPNQWYDTVRASGTDFADTFDINLSSMNTNPISNNHLGGRFGAAPGTISRFSIDVQLNPYTGGTVTCNLLHTPINVAPGGTATGMVISIPPGVTGEFTDATHTFTFSARTGLIPAYTSVGGTGTGTFSVNSHLWTFTGTDGRHDFVGQFNLAGNETGATYMPLWSTGAGTDETKSQNMAAFDLKWSNIRCFLNSISGAGTLKSRINGADGKQAISLVGSGWLEDTTHFDLVRKGEVFTLQGNSVGNRLIYAWASTVEERPRIDDCNYIIIE